MTTFYKGKENKKGDAIDGAKIFKRKDADID